MVADSSLANLRKGGRKKGAVNKTTTLAKEAIALAADKLGGVDRLVEWAKEDEKNEHSFWSSIYPRLLPLQVNAELAANVVHQVTHRVIE